MSYIIQEIQTNYFLALSQETLKNKTLFTGVILAKRLNVLDKLTVEVFQGEPYFVIDTITDENIFNLTETVKKIVEYIVAVENKKFKHESIVEKIEKCIDTKEFDYLCKLLGFNYKYYSNSFAKLLEILYLAGFDVTIKAHENMPKIDFKVSKTH